MVAEIDMGGMSALRLFEDKGMELSGTVRIGDLGLLRDAARLLGIKPVLPHVFEVGFYDGSSLVEAFDGHMRPSSIFVEVVAFSPEYALEVAQEAAERNGFPIGCYDVYEDGGGAPLLESGKPRGRHAAEGPSDPEASLDPVAS